MRACEHAAPAAGFLDHYLGPLAALLQDPSVAEIAVNPDGGVWVERAGAAKMVQTGVRLGATDAARLGRQIAGEAGQRLSEAQPIAGCKLDLATGDGAALRVQVLAPPVVSATAICIRRIALRRFSLADLAARGALKIGPQGLSTEDICENPLAKAADMQEFLRAAVLARKTILISGGTSTGKTTFLRALLTEADPRDRIVTIEDARELHPAQANTVSVLASRRREAEGALDAATLLEATLRMRPDRIVLGELRGVEAFTFLEAINTGHPGGLTTIHAESPGAAFERLAFMALRANRGLSRGEVIDYARSLIDVVVQLGRDASGARRIRAIETRSCSV